MQCARAIPFTWLGSGSCQVQPSRLNTNKWMNITPIWTKEYKHTLCGSSLNSSLWTPAHFIMLLWNVPHKKTVLCFLWNDSDWLDVCCNLAPNCHGNLRLNQHEHKIKLCTGVVCPDSLLRGECDCDKEMCLVTSETFTSYSRHFIALAVLLRFSFSVISTITNNSLATAPVVMGECDRRGSVYCTVSCVLCWCRLIGHML